MIKNNKTESEIFDQIRESLDRYEEAYIPGSWENFLQKRRHNNRIIFLRIASGIAACLLIGFLGINYFQSEKSDESVATIEQSTKSDKSLATAGEPSGTEKSVATIEQSTKTDQSVATAEPSTRSDQSVATAGEPNKSDKSVATTGQATNIISEKHLQAAMVAGSEVKPGSGVKSGSEVKPGSDAKQSVYGGVKTAPTTGGSSSLAAEGQKKITNPQPAQGLTPESREQVAALPSEAAPKTPVSKADTAKSISDTTRTRNLFLNSPQPADNQQLAAESKRKVRFGVNFSPGVSTTESTNSLNYMGGITADISLSSKVALSTGLQFENQSYVKKMPGIVSSANTPVNQTKTTLTNLDFPVNITWKFAAEKTHAYYVSAGLSSLVYLSQENKNTTYSQDLIPVSSLVNGEEIKSYSIVDRMSVTQDAVTPAQTFDLAGRVNLMVGYELKLSDRINIHFEPYAKIPTSSQEAGSLNHTTTGINFKISF